MPLEIGPHAILRAVQSNTGGPNPIDGRLLSSEWNFIFLFLTLQI